MTSCDELGHVRGVGLFADTCTRCDAQLLTLAQFQALKETPSE